MLDTTLSQGIEALPQDRSGEFQIAILQGHRIQPLPQLIGEGGKFADRQAVAAAVAADQNPEGTMGAMPGHDLAEWARGGSAAGEVTGKGTGRFAGKGAAGGESHDRGHLS
jgi:hypothetical protein